MFTFSNDAVSRAHVEMPKWFLSIPIKEFIVEPYPAELDNSGIGSKYDSSVGDQPAFFKIALNHPQKQLKSSAEITAFHETYPGHHLQVSFSQENTKNHKLSNEVYFHSYVEGWARYAEAFAEEIGLYLTPTAALEFYTLRKLAEEKLGNDFDIKIFHQKVLENGSVPLWLLRIHVEEWINVN